MESSTIFGLLFTACVVAGIVGLIVYWKFYTVQGQGPLSPSIALQTSIPVDGTISGGGQLIGYTSDFAGCVQMMQPDDYGVGFYISQPKGAGQSEYACYTYNADTIKAASGCVGPAASTGDSFSKSLYNFFQPCPSS